jgi:iron complex outermembrane recepter protein
MKTLSLLAGSALLSTMLIAAPAFAQEQDVEATQDDDFHQDEGIVVTAPYFERLDLLAGTSSLSGEDLAAETEGQIGEMLTKLPGLSATSFGPGASRPVIRGSQGNRVAVLTDGIGNIDASNTSADHAVTIDALTTERIEVLRGPAVLLFGGQATGGAVNVIDKRIPRNVPDEPIHIDALAGYSSAANEYSAGASVDVPVGDRFVVHVDGSYRNSDDLRIGGSLLSSTLQEEALAFAAAQTTLGNTTEEPMRVAGRQRVDACPIAASKHSAQALAVRSSTTAEIWACRSTFMTPSTASQSAPILQQRLRKTAFPST